MMNTYSLYKVDKPKRPPCFEETSRRRVHTCYGVLWFRSPRMGSRFLQISVFCSLFSELSVCVYIHEVQHTTTHFFCNIFMKKSSWRKCRRKFRRQFPDSRWPDKTTIYRLVKIINETGSVQNKKRQVNKRALTDDKLGGICFQIE